MGKYITMTHQKSYRSLLYSGSKSCNAYCINMAVHNYIIFFSLYLHDICEYKYNNFEPAETTLNNDLIIEKLQISPSYTSNILIHTKKNIC